MQKSDEGSDDGSNTGSEWTITASGARSFQHARTGDGDSHAQPKEVRDKPRDPISDKACGAAECAPRREQPVHGDPEDSAAGRRNSDCPQLQAIIRRSHCSFLDLTFGCAVAAFIKCRWAATPNRKVR